MEKRNLLILWIANFLVASSTTMIMPFLSLYIETMGDYSTAFVSRWASLIFGVTFVTAFLFSPIWGRLGDKRGYKPNLIIIGFGLSINLLLMGFMDSVFELFILRFFMGAVTGFIPASLALMSSQTSKKKAGEVLGTLQTGNVTGALFGPLFGGFLADTVGFQYTFVITSIAILIATLFVIFGVIETKKENKNEKQTNYSSKEVLTFIFQKKTLGAIMLISLLLQSANQTIQPLLALYVSQLSQAETVAFLSGLAFSATGFGNLIATRSWGRLGDRIGYEKVIMMLLIFGAIIFIPQALVKELWQLVLLRFLFGVATGGIIPCITAYIRKTAPIEVQGEIQGYSVSFRYLGNVAGPVLAGTVSGIIGISSVFYVTSGILFSAFLLLFWTVKNESGTKQKTKPVHLK